jgi:hypothetical protein
MKPDNTQHRIPWVSMEAAYIEDIAYEKIGRGGEI